MLALISAAGCRRHLVDIGLEAAVENDEFGSLIPDGSKNKLFIAPLIVVPIDKG